MKRNLFKIRRITVNDLRLNRDLNPALIGELLGRLSGDCSELSGNCSGLSGDCSRLSGDCSELYGDCSGLYGDCSWLSGDLDQCEITEQERKNGVSLSDLVKVKKT